jgi:hypothetical protein
MSENKNVINENVITNRITSRIILLPVDLININISIYNKLQKLKYTCNKNGYIMKIGNILPISNPLISRTTGNCICNITYEIFTLKPEKGHIYKTIVTNIFNEGIFVEYIDGIRSIKNLKVFLPRVVENLNIGDIINVIIDIVRYENHTYQCIGSVYNAQSADA